MKAGKSYYFLAWIIFLPLLSGCMTSIMWHDAVGCKLDFFSPTAIYRSKANGSLAIEGVLTKAGQQNGVSRYLIIPQNVLTAAHLQTKSDVTFRDLASLPPKVRQEMYLSKKLNFYYEKIASIQNQPGVNVNQRITVNVVALGKAVAFLPFTFAIDAVTFPLQIYIIKGMEEHPIE